MRVWVAIRSTKTSTSASSIHRGPEGRATTRACARSAGVPTSTVSAPSSEARTTAAERSSPTGDRGPTETSVAAHEAGVHGPVVKRGQVPAMVTSKVGEPDGPISGAK